MFFLIQSAEKYLGLHQLFCKQSRSEFNQIIRDGILVTEGLFYIEQLFSFGITHTTTKNQDLN